MSLEPFITHQKRWEQIRKIKNGNFGGDRIQHELDEAKAEEDPYKKLIEYADVFIITMGSVGALLEALDMPDYFFDKVVEAKLEMNNIKYPPEVFELLETDAAIGLCRAAWRLHNSG